ncbi:hypothetical protein MYAM1_002522 [Malassezia yamatoensis]|uniref:CRAL-TRIO domain-containing protein n=1 Tax=Malassezia yamatoensis TaxID=253288 RepID=A0AAJ6CGW5_9BASI|nr:hypothetical protein MYAM1_002522 [Malassezia yamatoensis]
MGGDPRGALSESAENAAQAYAELQKTYEEHVAQIVELRATLMEEVPKQLASTGQYSDDELRIAREYVDDVALLFRFLRRTNFDVVGMKSMLYKSIKWHLEADVCALATDLLHSEYMSDTKNGMPLFWLHSKFRDRLGRPCLAMRLQIAERALDGLRELKTIIIASIDVVRRYLRFVNRKCPQSGAVLQSVLVVDVSESGIFNFDLELLPFLVDLFKNHYPGLFGTVYVVNYGWLQSGLWRIMKPVLPQKFLARLMFMDKEQLNLHFDAALPQCLGGELAIPIAPETSDVFNFYARSVAWRKSEQTSNQNTPLTRSRQPDFESIYDVMARVGPPYSSKNATPIIMRTPATSGYNTPRSHAPSSPPSSLQGTLPSVEDIEQRSYGARHSRQRSEFSTYQPESAHNEQDEESGSFFRNWIEPWVQPSSKPSGSKQAPSQLPPPTEFSRSTKDSKGNGKARELSVEPATSPLPSPSLESPQVHSTEHNTVTRYFSWRAHKYARLDGHVSPYNIENPYFGYPATYVDRPEPSDEESTTTVVKPTDPGAPRGAPRQLRVRRRKRDLLRTLVYLFLLRLINLYSRARRYIIVVYSVFFARRNREQMSRTIARSLTRTFRDIQMDTTNVLWNTRLRTIILAGVIMIIGSLPRRRPISTRFISSVS